MEKILKTFVETAASALTERWHAINTDRQSRNESDRCEELAAVSVELGASDEESETLARVAIIDSPE